MTRRKLDQRRLVSAALRKPPVGQELAAARLWAAERFPYLAHALFAMRVAPIYSLGTVAIDRYWNLRLDPALITNWEPAQLGSMLIHHVSHLLRDHAARAESLRINPAEARRWRIAADAEIEDDLIDAGLQPPYQPILPATLNCETHQLAEQYFRAPWPTPDNPDGDAAESAMRRVSGRGTAGGCGSGSDGIPRAWDSTAWITSDQGALLRYKTARDMVEHNGKHPGTVPGRMLRWAEVILDNRVDWRKALGAEIRRGIAAITGLVDYSYQRPSRRAAAVPNVVLPWLVHPIPEVAVVIDTSGSVDIRMLGKALGQVDAILRRLAQRRVRVLACDAVVHDVQTVTSARSIELVGGGGTDLRRGIAAAAALRPRADIVVVLTDGYTPWPEQAPVGLRVVVGLLEGGATTLPTWARVVRIHDTD